MTQEDESTSKNKPTFKPASITECQWSLRDFEDYKYFLFPDADYQPKNIQEVYAAGFRYFKPSAAKTTEQLPTVSPEEVQRVFGGINGFFHAGAKILDVGSGSGKATIEMADKFSSQGVQVTGLDIAYTTDKPITHDPDIFVAGSWVDVPLANNTFTGILSCESFPRHAATYASEVNSKDIKAFQEITRVANQGAIWRATTGGSPIPQELIISLMLENGWEVYIDPFLMIARLQNKQDNISSNK